MDAMRYQRIKHLGKQTPVPIQVRFITLATPEEAARFSLPAGSVRCVDLRLPALRNTGRMFPRCFSGFCGSTPSGGANPPPSGRMEQLLSFYTGPETSASCLPSASGTCIS